MSRSTWSRRMTMRSPIPSHSRLDLRLGVAVADVPAELHQVRRVAPAHLVELLLAGDDLGEASVSRASARCRRRASPAGGSPPEPRRRRARRMSLRRTRRSSWKRIAKSKAIGLAGDAGRHIVNRAQGLRRRLHTRGRTDSHAGRRRSEGPGRPAPRDRVGIVPPRGSRPARGRYRRAVRMLNVAEASRRCPW